MGLVSEAGMPAVADPGSSVVRAAHELGITVVPLVGPVSLMLALAASGLNGQNFAFVGYLPQDPQERVQRIRELESLALKSGQTQLFIETPYRNAGHAAGPAANPAAQHTPGREQRADAGRAPACQRQCQKLEAQAVLLDNATPAVFAIGR